MLTQRTTLDDYYGDALRQEERLRLERMAEPDGEWWIWECGSEYLMQRGGIALVKQGQIVWQH